MGLPTVWGCLQWAAYSVWHPTVYDNIQCMDAYNVGQPTVWGQPIVRGWLQCLGCLQGGGGGGLPIVWGKGEGGYSVLDS